MRINMTDHQQWYTDKGHKNCPKGPGFFEIQLKFFDVCWMWCGEALRAQYSPGESIAHRAVALRLTMAATRPIVQSEWIKAQTHDGGYTRTCIMSFHLGRADQPSVTNCNCSQCNAQRESESMQHCRVQSRGTWHRIYYTAKTLSK